MTMEKRTNISIIIFLSLIFLINLFVVFPLLKEINSSSQWLVSEKSRFLSLDEKIGELKRFDVLYKDRAEILGQVDALFIDSDVPIDFINFLERTGQQSSVGLDIAPFSVGKSEKDSWPFLNFQVTVSGQFPAFLNFLEKIENSPYLIEIQGLTISQGVEAKQSPGLVKALITFKAYSKP